MELIIFRVSRDPSKKCGKYALKINNNLCFFNDYEGICQQADLSQNNRFDQFRMSRFPLKGVAEILLFLHGQALIETKGETEAKSDLKKRFIPVKQKSLFRITFRVNLLKFFTMEIIAYTCIKSKHAPPRYYCMHQII